MLVLQQTSIFFFKRFPTAKHSGKLYIRHIFRYGQLTNAIEFKKQSYIMYTFVCYQTTDNTSNIIILKAQD